MSLKVSRLLSVAAALTFAAGTASAQVFTPMPLSFNNTPSTSAAPSRPFWDNLSDDGAGCNIGFILSNAATSGCANQRPAGWLPFTGTPAASYYNSSTAAASFLFAAGNYAIDLIYANPKTFGDVAGGNTSWGIYQGAVDTNLNPDGSLPMAFTAAGNWGFWIDVADGTGGRKRSGIGADARQFALFLATGSTASVNSGIVSAGGSQTFYLGLEDKACASSTAPSCTAASDFDNNDVLFRVRTVPEPGTYLLLASGLAGLGVMARRRRRA